MSLKLDTLDTSIQVSLCEMELENVDWKRAFEVQHGESEFLVWAKYYKKFKFLHLFIKRT